MHNKVKIILFLCIANFLHLRLGGAAKKKASVDNNTVKKDFLSDLVTFQMLRKNSEKDCSFLYFQHSFIFLISCRAP